MKKRRAKTKTTVDLVIADCCSPVSAPPLPCLWFTPCFEKKKFNEKKGKQKICCLNYVTEATQTRILHNPHFCSQ
jgi:hypothetical protein